MLIATHQLNAKRLLLRQVVTAFVVSLLFIAATNLSAAQSTDRDHPTPLKSNELKGELDGSDTEFFYSFVAGPGELTITFDVKASGTNAGANLDLFDKNSRSLLSLLAQGVDRGSERMVESVRLGRQQTVVMRLKGIRYGSSGGQGTYMVRLGGAAALEGKAATDGGNPADSRMGLPTSGTLRIEMSDGSAQEFDLRRVRQVTVKP
jgi:hypothetical protein